MASVFGHQLWGDQVIRYETPHDVARELTRHAPRRLRTVLDPAVGSGALLRPLAPMLMKQRSQVFCIDLDAAALSQARHTLSPLLPAGATYVNADFVTWSRRAQPLFDCIVMNPPFAAGKSDLYRISLPLDLGELAEHKRFMPSEAAFVCCAIGLLREGGRLLAVLPCSIAMSESVQWLRDLFQSVGSIRFVHELPPRSFPNVESRMYLFVFDKGVRRRKVILFNHDLAAPERLDLPLTGKGGIGRLDFGYHRAMRNLKRLSRYARFGWQALEEVAAILRGDIDSPLGPTCAVHTSDYSTGFWRRSSRHKPLRSHDPERTIRRGDLLVKRVGRNCHKTFGRPLGLQGIPCSDCVLIIRPKKSGISTHLLFSLRTLFELDWSKPLLERGTGASYVSHESLLKTCLPTRLHKCFPKLYASFLAAQNGASSAMAQQAVRCAAWRIDRYAGR